MVNLKVYKQTNGYCGPACAKSKLEYYGKRFSEAFLARLMQADRNSGVEAPEIVAAYKRLGYKKSFYEDNVSIERLRKIAEKFPVTVDWTPEDIEDGHYCTVIQVSEKNIVLGDPFFNKIRCMKLTDFVKNWYDFEGLDPALKPRYYRRMIVLRR